jgi:putative tryptophan/tyrosine transport system substrate-binding protein
MATPKLVGIMHSGTKGIHDDHISALKAGVRWAYVGDWRIEGPLYAGNDLGKMGENAAALVKIPVDVLVAAGGTASSEAAKGATNQISIVFTSVADSSRPADNMTGICARTSELDSVRLNLLHELLPGKTKFGALVNSARSNYKPQKSMLDSAAAMLGVGLDYQDVNPKGLKATTIGDAFQFWKKSAYDGILVTADPFFNDNRKSVIPAAAAIPTIYQWSEFADETGLISYGPNLTVAYKLAGIHVGHILRGANPASLPILPLNNFELVINLTTAAKMIDAKTLDRVPPTLLIRADRIIL